MDIQKRIAYLHQVQDLLVQLNQPNPKPLSTNDSDRSKSMEILNDNKKKPQQISLTKLNSYYGYLSKEIAMKHNVQILNCDELRQFRCKRCFCQYDFDKMLHQNQLQLTKKRPKKQLNLICPECRFKRKIIFRQPIKTKFEKILHDSLVANNVSNVNDKNKNQKSKKS